MTLLEGVTQLIGYLIALMIYEQPFKSAAADLVYADVDDADYGPCHYKAASLQSASQRKALAQGQPARPPPRHETKM